MRSLALIAVIACASPRRPPAVEPVGQLRPPSPDEAARVPPPMAIGKLPPERCSIRIAHGVITVDGDPMKRADAVAVCKQRALALVEVADPASEAEWLRLERELHNAGVMVMTRGVRGHDHANACSNPLVRCMEP